MLSIYPRKDPAKTAEAEWIAEVVLNVEPANGQQATAGTIPWYDLPLEAVNMGHEKTN